MNASFEQRRRGRRGGGQGPGRAAAAIPAFGLGLLIAAVSGSGAAVAAGSGLRPDSWGGFVSAGRDQRTRGPAGHGDPALGTGDSRYWFAEPTDWQGQLQVWGRWKTRAFSQRTRLHLAYTRFEWAEGRILGRDLFEVELQQRLTERNEVELEVGYSPQTYLRHRVDKDAPAGSPRFRPEAYREVDSDLLFTRHWTEGFETSLFVTHTRRDETKWFRERDRRRWGAGLSFATLGGERARIEPLYEYRVSRSRNEPDLGSDLSYREHVVGLLLRGGTDSAGGPWDAELDTQVGLRRYTTDDPEDTRRYHRNEQIYYWKAKLRRTTAPLAPFLAIETTGRRVDVPTAADALEEDGQVDRTLLRLGMEWRY